MSRAVVARAFGGPEVLEFIQWPVPEPGAGEVTIQVRAAGMNPADLKRLRGNFGRGPNTLPMVSGMELSGVITAVGPGADGPAGPLAVGDEVAAFRISGGYAESVTVPAKDVLPKPPSLSWEEAAGLLLAGATAMHLVEMTEVGEGDRVIVHGASGGVGALAVQLAILRGARVVGTAGPGSFDRVRALGAEVVAYGEGLTERLRELLPDGADAAFDTIGTDEAIDASVDLVPDRDRIVSIAAYEYGAKHGVRLIGSGPGADPGNELRDAARLPLLELAGAGKLRVEVGRTFPLARAADAMRFLAEGHPGGKVVLVP